MVKVGRLQMLNTIPCILVKLSNEAPISNSLVPDHKFHRKTKLEELSQIERIMLLLVATVKLLVNIFDPWQTDFPKLPTLHTHDHTAIFPMISIIFLRQTTTSELYEMSTQLLHETRTCSNQEFQILSVGLIQSYKVYE